jgi:hypothetical protein
MSDAKSGTCAGGPPRRVQRLVAASDPQVKQA